MRLVMLAVALHLIAAVPSRAADGLSGTWTTATGPEVRIFVFKTAGETFSGIVCGPCDEPDSVFRIEDGHLSGGDRATFFIRYDAGGPRVRPYRDQVDATLGTNQITMQARREGESNGSVTTTLARRVVEGFELAVAPAPARPASADSASSFSGGRWVSVGRNAQQNWVLKVRGDSVWGLVCGPCTPDVVAMIDDGRIDGDTLTFAINHIDTPRSAERRGVDRNLMRGTIERTGNPNVMKFNWVREGHPDQTGQIVMIGPIR